MRDVAAIEGATVVTVSQVRGRELFRGGGRELKSKRGWAGLVLVGGKS